MDRPHRILLVDDEEVVLRGLRRVLARDGLEVELAQSADEALECVRMGPPPHVVISDFRMPGTDGVAFLTQMRKEYPRIQRILITGSGDVSTIRAAVNEARVFRVLMKPVEELALWDAARAAVVEWEREAANLRLNVERTTLLSRAKREWEVAFDALLDPLMIIDRGFRIVRGNVALAKHLGREVREIKGKTCHGLRARSTNQLPRDADGVCTGCPARAALETGAVAEAELRTSSDQVISLAVFPIVDDESGTMVCRYTDLTASRAMARKLALADKLSAIGLLAGGVAHEVNNPLGAILAFAQLLQRTQLPVDEQKEYLREIEESAIRCKKIVERLLSFARQAHRDEPRDFSLNDVVAETAFLVERSYLPANIKLERDLDAEVLPITGNPNEIQQVLLNLISNARDAMPGGGVVRVRTRNLLDGTVELAVSDAGQGIAPEILEHIFDPFFTTKPEGKGTGLGLAVSYGIIREHRGRMAVRSKVGEGTEFQVVLPAALSPPRATTVK